MNKTFKYSILKYIHSQFLGEELNIGIIFLFPSENRIIFRHPQRISKFKNIYHNFSESHINQYLRSFDEASKRINPFEYSENLDKILNDLFLVKDASTLQFTESKTVVQYTNDIGKIVNHYFNLYFPEEIVLENKRELIQEIKHLPNRTDKDVTNSFRNLLEQKAKNIKRFLKSSVEVKNELASFKSDLVWQNHTKNAVKGLSLDLKNEESISDKALLINAKLNYLEKAAIEDNIRFDLIIAAPHKIEFNNAYEKALIILNDIKAPKKIITEDQLEEYTIKTIQELERI